jgi:hypothetical protein
MRYLAGLFLAVLCLSVPSPGYCESFDAFKDYSCDRVSAGVWHYEGFRAQDGAFLSMVFDRAPVTELSKYGADVHYLPDSDQPYYPFIARLAGELLCSPATTGKRFDAALSWVAPYKDNVKVTGSTRLQGGIKPKAQGKKVKVRLQHNDKVVWEAELTDTVEKTFELAAPVSKGDRLSLCVQNSGDESGDITAIGMHVETTKK